MPAAHHRGPDDQGTYVGGDFGFGMRRLSIIDVAGGHQPIVSAVPSALTDEVIQAAGLVY